MPVEMIGWIAPQVSSELIRPTGPIFSADVVAETARIHEAADFDRVLIGYFSNAPDGFLIGAHAASVTHRLQFLLAHRPGFVAPTVAARKLATLDQLTGGRLAVHLIAGGSDADQAKDGDHVDHAGRYRRTDEYAGVLRRTWTETRAFDHQGEFYDISRAHSDIQCLQVPHLPVYGGGGSDAAIDALAPHVDVFMLWGEPLAETEAFMQRVRTVAARHGRRPTFSLSTRPIIAATDELAWERAHQILEGVEARLAGRPPKAPDNEASKRLLVSADAGEVHDTCLWTRLAVATGAPGNSTALVGSPETVATSLVRYYELGATSLLIRGYDPLPDAEQYGRELIPLVRAKVAALDATP
ncbi:MAG: LLM class flavin-dependent oxidoreductase [Actinomycetota bacterium]|nr:LLM class flavin-dependent oxidoreductase [Actinomycetota bacterium]